MQLAVLEEVENSLKITNLVQEQRKQEWNARGEGRVNTTPRQHFIALKRCGRTGAWYAGPGDALLYLDVHGCPEMWRSSTTDMSNYPGQDSAEVCLAVQCVVVVVVVVVVVMVG